MLSFYTANGQIVSLEWALSEHCGQKPASDEHRELYRSLAMRRTSSESFDIRSVRS